MNKSYMVYYYVVQNGVNRKGCILMHGCTTPADAKRLAVTVLGKDIYIYDVRNQ